MERELLISPLSPKNFDVYKILEEIDKDPLETSILEQSLIPIRKIVIDEFAKYFIVLNKYGQVFIIDLDVSGNSILTNKDLIAKKIPAENVEERKKVAVDYSIAYGALHSVGTDVNGILFVTKKGMSIVYTNSSLVDMQDVYTYNNEITSAFDISPNPIPYVIIRLSEILKNNELSLNRVFLSTKKLRGDAIDECNGFTRSFLAKMNETMSLFQEMLQISDRKFVLLSEEITSEKTKVDSMHITDKEYPDVIDTLASKNDNLIALSETLLAFKRFTPLLVRLYDNIKVSLETIKKESVGISLARKVVDKLEKTN